MADNGNRRQKPSVTSKVMAVLGAFTYPKPVLTLNELAKQTDLPLSTAYRLVSDLVASGALERVEGGGYRIGMRLWEIGSLAPASLGLARLAVPYMQDLYEATHENVQLAVREGREVLYIEKILGRRSIAVKSRRGGRLPLHATGVGKVLLAFGPRELLDEVLAAGLRRYTAHTIVAPGVLRTALAEVRRTGLAFTREEMTLGTMSVASPLLDAEGNAVAAMSIVVRSTRADLHRLAPAVRTAAMGASRHLRQINGGGQVIDSGVTPG
jgi:DNA-binding IclR family transcriptional regulator